MAVSVRAACSMPRLHSMDFDLSPKNQFDVPRWGNSNQVLILSLLEIVEQDSIHVQEAAPRLQPGWVRNACAAFEKGVAFTNFESHRNVQNNINCQVSNVQNVSDKNPNQDSEVPSRLPKAKSWESLDSCRKKTPKKAKVPLPKVQPKTCVACKRSLDRDDAISGQDSKAITVGPSNEVSSTNHAECQDKSIDALSLERRLSVEPPIVTRQPVEGVPGVLVVQDISEEKKAAVDAIEELPQLQEPEQSNAAKQNDSLHQSQVVDFRSNDSHYQSQMRVDLQEDDRSNSHFPANLHGAKETQPSNSCDTPSVRPKLRVFSQCVGSLLKEGSDSGVGEDASFKNCMVQNGYARVAVCVKSCSLPVTNKSDLLTVDRENGYECADNQCAIGESATEIHLRSVSCQGRESEGCLKEVHSLTVSQRNHGGAEYLETPVEKEKTPGLTITLANMQHYPPDRLETFLLMKETYKNSFPISWENFVVHFNSSRQMIIPSKRFCAKFELSFNNERGQSDNMKSLKKALAKKWSRDDDDKIKELKQRLSVLKLGSLRFQLLCHPLVSYDITELEETESSIEEALETITPFRRIPTYVIAKIFCLLKTKDLAALKCTCKDFQWLINQFDITGTDSQWVTGKDYRWDPCMHCGKIQDPRGDVSLCQRHPKAFYKYSVINRQYWTCCNAVKETTEGCEIGLHNNRWTTSKFQPNFICKPWKSQSWYITANAERWCDKEHL